VALRGEEVTQGETLAAPGMILTPTVLSLIAAAGHAHVAVHRRPQVALLATGDEIKEVESLVEGPWNTCNNRHLLAWLVRLHGGIPFSLGIVGDDPELIAERLSGVDADLIITTGGTGRGDKDFIRRVWKILGIKPAFRQINLSPGKSTALGAKEGSLYCSLSGNVWASRAAFEEILAPLLLRWQGMKETARPTVSAKLNGSIKKKKGEYRVIRGDADMQSMPPSFTPLHKKTRSLSETLRWSSGYVLLHAQEQEVRSGSTVKVRLHDSSMFAFPSQGLLPRE
jgi:molybdopterin molybdotransferase